VVDLTGESLGDPAAFGEQLRRTREGAGLRIEDIVVETKVSKSVFEALEEGRFSHLPERVFCRSFVAQYARTVGVDEGPILEAFDLAWASYCASSGAHTNLVLIDDDLGTAIRWRFWIPIAAGVLILLIAAAVILRSSTSMDHGLAPDPRRSGASRSTGEPATRPSSKPTPKHVSKQLPTPLAPETTIELRVEVDPGEECWIHYRDREGKTGQRLLGDGHHLNLELAGPVKLTIGNAGAAKITIGGRTYGDLGLPGQVIHTEISDGGFTRLVPGEADHS